MKKTKTATASLSARLSRRSYLNVALESSNLREQGGVRAPLLAVLLRDGPQPCLQGWRTKIKSHKGEK